jgi:hypothetical protein
MYRRWGIRPAIEAARRKSRMERRQRPISGSIVRESHPGEGTPFRAVLAPPLDAPEFDRRIESLASGNGCDLPGDLLLLFSKRCDGVRLLDEGGDAAARFRDLGSVEIVEGLRAEPPADHPDESAWVRGPWVRFRALADGTFLALELSHTREAGWRAARGGTVAAASAGLSPVVRGAIASSPGRRAGGSAFGRIVAPTEERALRAAPGCFTRNGAMEFSRLMPLMRTAAKDARCVRTTSIESPGMTQSARALTTGTPDVKVVPVSTPPPEPRSRWHARRPRQLRNAISLRTKTKTGKRRGEGARKDTASRPIPPARCRRRTPSAPPWPRGSNRPAMEWNTSASVSDSKCQNNSGS